MLEIAADHHLCDVFVNVLEITQQMRWRLKTEKRVPNQLQRSRNAEQ
jgi:hypothetical protein